jgi:hypothetical protein
VRVAVIAGSAAIHVVVLWWLAGDEPGERRRAVPETRPSRTPITTTSAPIEITLITPAQTPAPPVDVPAAVSEFHDARPRGARRARTTRVASAGAGTGGGPEPTDAAAVAESPTAPSWGPSLLQMRRGADLRLDAATAERIASASPAVTREEVHGSGRLEPQPGGRAVVHDTVTTVDVDADGSVTFRDKPTLDVKSGVPMGVLLDPAFRGEVRQHLAKWLEDPSEGMRYGPSQDLPRHLQAVPGACDVWGSDFCQDPLAPDFEKRLRSLKTKLAGGVNGTLDVTDLATRAHGGDPYLSRKRKILDESRDERTAMSERFRAQQRARSAELMRRNLERLWATELEPRARREALFELWNECDDDEAGARARAIVIGWIRSRLPRGSEQAFTDDEIATMRAHSTSAHRFEPYD